ncbi:CPBP family glutamic-type intramembrane protease [Clostridium sp. Marseille-QA1073]
MPDFYIHVLERTKPILFFDKLPALIIQLLILAFTEEVVFRGLLQAQISTRIRPAYAITITSFFFSIAHYSSVQLVLCSTIYFSFL